MPRISRNCFGSPLCEPAREPFPAAKMTAEADGVANSGIVKSYIPIEVQASRKPEDTEAAVSPNASSAPFLFAKPRYS